MVHRPPPNCRHLDNWRGCALASRWSWFNRITGTRPHCILDRTDEPRDGEWTCPDQDALPRPRPPAPQPSAAKRQTPTIVSNP